MKVCCSLGYPLRSPAGSRVTFTPTFFRRAIGNTCTGKPTTDPNGTELALRAAAKVIVSHVDDLKDYVGHERFWALCQAAKTMADGTREPFRVFWTELLPAVRAARACYTQRGEWVIPGDATVVDSSYRDCVPAIDALGLSAVHEDLDFARSLLTDKTNGPGVKILRLPLMNDSVQ